MTFSILLSLHETQEAVTEYSKMLPQEAVTEYCKMLPQETVTEYSKKMLPINDEGGVIVKSYGNNSMLTFNL